MMSLNKSTNVIIMLFQFVAGGPPYEIPTFQAHKVECVTTSHHRQRYKVVDGTGDALVIQVINNEIFPIHICVISYQADGSIVVLYPPKNASSLGFCYLKGLISGEADSGIPL